MIILDGNKLAKKVLSSLNGQGLKLAVVLVGENKVSNSYIAKKREASKVAGIEFDFYNYPKEIKKEEFEKEIKGIKADGIVIQLPLPEDLRGALNLIPVKKDPDVLSDLAFEEFVKGGSIIPPVASAVKKLLEEYNIGLEGKKIAVIGKGKLVGKPIAVWLNNIKADFKVIDRSVVDIGEAIKDCDIVISGAGSPGLVKKDMIKEGAVLIDAGTSSEDGVIKGDIDKDAYEKASYVAPVPGGVGPMAVACLIENLVKLNATKAHELHENNL